MICHSYFRIYNISMDKNGFWEEFNINVYVSRLDKEQALAEETRATLAALDAMRKAHESEVRREVDKFKAEFLSRGAQGGERQQLSNRHQ